MKTFTNMAWPDDPYCTGQQLYRRPSPRLIAFTVDQFTTASLGAPHAFAVVHLPLHRTQALAVTEQTLAFGFLAASIDSGNELSVLAKLADLDLMQARRHAAVLAGYQLTDDLVALQSGVREAVLRGVVAVEQEWAARGSSVRGRAAMFDCGLDLPNTASLEEACEHSGIIPAPVRSVGAPDVSASAQHAAAIALERALAIAMVSARYLGRYTWEGSLQIEVAMAASAWDCFPEVFASDERSMRDSRLG
jgi:hypothetical protein